MEPFNADVDARRADYANVGKGQLLVTKVFPTIQGEGPWTGLFAVFVRLAGCNLGSKTACPFCDTDFKLAEGKARSFDEIIDEAGSYITQLIVLTGGEPLLQPQTVPFLKRCSDRGYRVQIETNGYFWPADMDELVNGYNRYMAVTVVVSPKVNMRGVYPPLPMRGGAVDALKVLVTADAASPYHELHPEIGRFQTAGTPVYVSPITVWRQPPGPLASIWSDECDRDATRRNYTFARDLAMAHNLRLSLQTHLFCEAE